MGLRKYIENLKLDNLVAGRVDSIGAINGEHESVENIGGMSSVQVTVNPDSLGTYYDAVKQSSFSSDYAYGGQVVAVAQFNADRRITLWNVTVTRDASTITQVSSDEYAGGGNLSINVFTGSNDDQVLQVRADDDGSWAGTPEYIRVMVNAGGYQLNFSDLT
jgi:hypothetical protein